MIGKSENFYLGLCCFLLLLGLSSCSSLGDLNVNSSNIREIQQAVNLSNPTSPVLKIKGTVKTLARFIGKGAYEVQDATGSIWVISPAPLPNPGDVLLIKGIAHYQSIVVQGKEIGEVYLEEQDRVKQSANQS